MPPSARDRELDELTDVRIPSEHSPSVSYRLERRIGAGGITADGGILEGRAPWHGQPAR